MASSFPAYIPFASSAVTVAAGGLTATSLADDSITADKFAANALDTNAVAATAVNRIKSIQRGSTNLTGTNQTVTATLSPTVDASKSELRFLGFRSLYNGATNWIDYPAVQLLSDGTGVYISRGGTTNLGGTGHTVCWEVTERY